MDYSKKTGVENKQNKLFKVQFYTFEEWSRSGVALKEYPTDLAFSSCNTVKTG